MCLLCVKINVLIEWGSVLIFLSFLDWANKVGKLKMKYIKAVDRDGRN